ncbi:MAG: DegT/DnrJ/EryC1/StrS family aminotransferase [Deltaproteobacteria bacterium]|nr:DegT/DnrJ/EryC1/StrS family aminotransferase [Deltaproteobacteria bacterium]
MPGFELIGKEERDAVSEIFDRGGIMFRYGFDGPRQNIFKVTEFEAAFTKYLGCSHGHAVNTGTAAVRTALAALGIGPGDEVITQCFTFVATIEAIMEAGATPVLAEIDASLNMDPQDLENLITPRTKAVIPVHMLGAAADMDRITQVAERHQIPIIEDSCQAPGTIYKGKKTGTIGKMGCFSFDFVKTMTCGEGGMVVTNDESLYRRAAEFADHGHVHDPNVPRGADPHLIPGFNYRMTEIQAAVGLAQLAKLDGILAAQRRNKKDIVDGIKGLSDISFRALPDSAGDGGDTLVMTFPNKELAFKVGQSLIKDGVVTKILPDAMGWHFAGEWAHMLARTSNYAGRDLAACWPKSREILLSSVAVMIKIKMSDEDKAKIITGIKKALS